jgi:hypothetical protein
MAGIRRWLSAIVVAGGLLGAITSAIAQSSPEADFQILAVKPERLGKSFRLIPVGESEIDRGAYDAVVGSLPQSMFGGIVLPDYNESAEQTQCRAACIATKKCSTFVYVRRAKDRPLGLCRLRHAVEPPAVVAAPLPPPVAVPAPAPAVVHEPVPDAVPDAVVDLADVPAKAAPARITIGGKAKTGHASYLEADAPQTPVTFRFDAPVTGVTATIRARDIPKDRAWVVVDALDANGKRVMRTGMWVANNDQPQKVSVKTKAEKIAAVRVLTRGANVLIVDRLDFERTVTATAEPESAPIAAKTEPAVAEVIDTDPAPPVPEAEEITTALPPRTVAAETPAPGEQPVGVADAPSATPEAVAQPEAPVTPPVIAEPAEAGAEAPAAVVAPRADEPAPAVSLQDEQLPLLAAAGVLAFLVGGVGVYRSNYRARTLKRMSTLLVSDGMDRHTAGVEAEGPDMSLRFAVRSPAGIGARHTSITIVPDGVAA